MFSDAYDMQEVDDVIFEINCTMVNIKAGADVDIGANPSAEEQEEDLEEGTETVNNLVYSFRLQPTSFDKKTYLAHLKQYMKKVKAKLQESHPDRVDAFEKGGFGVC